MSAAKLAKYPLKMQHGHGFMRLVKQPGKRNPALRLAHDSLELQARPDLSRWQNLRRRDNGFAGKADADFHAILSLR